MTFISARSETRDPGDRHANDNLPAAPADLSILDLVQTDHDPDIARRTERLGVAVVVAMAVCLVAGPLIYTAL